MKKHSGFTLVELMITLSVLAILAGMAAPSMLDLIRNNRIASTASSFSTAASYARSEAIKRGLPVVLCQSSAPGASTPACASSGGWQQGWLAFVDTDASSSFTTGDTILRAWESPSPGASISSTNTQLIFNARGMPTATDTFTICVAPLSRVLAMNAAGRLHISAGACS